MDRQGRAAEDRAEDSNGRQTGVSEKNAPDEIDWEQEQLIIEIEGKMKQKTELISLFTIGWRIK